MPLSIAERIHRTLTTYTGGPVTNVKTFQDPKVKNVWAVRYHHPEGYTADALLHDIDDPDQVEDAEFTSWPPKSGNLKFF